MGQAVFEQASTKGLIPHPGIPLIAFGAVFGPIARETERWQVTKYNIGDVKTDGTVGRERWNGPDSFSSAPGTSKGKMQAGAGTVRVAGSGGPSWN